MSYGCTRTYVAAQIFISLSHLSKAHISTLKGLFANRNWLSNMRLANMPIFPIMAYRNFSTQIFHQHAQALFAQMKIAN